VSITKIKITILICVGSFYLLKPPGNGIKSVYLGEIEDFDAPSSQPVDQLEYTIQGRKLEFHHFQDTFSTPKTAGGPDTPISDASIIDLLFSFK
jgi:hypothetical protein